MDHFPQNKFKIINDPVFGFINIRYELAFHLIEHPLFQRLRRIRQLGMTHFVYPGANHTRFQHALGAMHLMNNAIEEIRGKGHEISREEAEAANVAILLHDIGHGPFSHTLERTLIKGVDHEAISLMMMEQLNQEFDGALTLAIDIFMDRYQKRFLHQLVSGQLDVDRLDYLRRDSFFTGVTEGAIGSDRIIKMLQVHGDQLVVEEKGIYSIEKFLVARRLMYWQVYLHKGVIAADQLLIMMLRRAGELASEGKDLFATPALAYFLYEKGGVFNESNQEEFLRQFSALDDNDIISAAKVWSEVDDPLLQFLCKGFINRKLFRIEISDQPFRPERVQEIHQQLADRLRFSEKELSHLVITDSISNHAYSNMDEHIQILGKDGRVKDISSVSEIMNLAILTREIEKFFLCYPKNLKELQ